jgi:hypothetical protein
MKITQGKIVNAYRTLLRLSEQQLPLPVAYALYKAKKALDPQWQFQLEQEQKMIAECKGVVDNGSVTFPSDDARLEYVKKALELNEMETEIEVPEIVLPEDSGLSLSMNEIDALDGIVKWGE